MPQALTETQDDLKLALLKDDEAKSVITRNIAKNKMAYTLLLSIAVMGGLFAAIYFAAATVIPAVVGFVSQFPAVVGFIAKLGLDIAALETISTLAASAVLTLATTVTAATVIGTVQLTIGLAYSGMKSLISLAKNIGKNKNTSVKPTAPEVKPTAPEVKPTAPEVKPTAPEVKPTAPEVKPTAPEVKPEVKPTAPEVKATTPAAAFFQPKAEEKTTEEKTTEENSAEKTATIK